MGTALTLFFGGREQHKKGEGVYFYIPKTESARETKFYNSLFTEIKNSEGNELGSKGFQNYITKFKDKPNNERLKLIIDNVLGSKYIQKDDLTIVVLDS